MAKSTLRVEINPEGVRAVLRGEAAPAIPAKLMAMGEAVKAAAEASNPDGEYYLSGYVGRNRYRVSVITANKSARESEAVDRNLTAALNAARGA